MGLELLFFGLALSLGQVTADIELPAEKSCLAGDPFKLEAKTAGTSIEWIQPDKCSLFPSESGKWAVFVSRTPGTYKIYAYTLINAKLSKPAVCTITVMGDIPPAPGPTPPAPTPPNPQPIPPAPPTLTKRLQTVFNGDSSPLKVKSSQKVILSGIYEAMIDHADNQAINTTAELLADLKSVVNQMLTPTALVDIRKAVAAKVAACLGTDPGIRLDPAMRQKAKDCFGRITKALDEVK